MSLLHSTVQLSRPAPTHRNTDLVVVNERPYLFRPAPWMAVPAVLYELHWPDGATTWHDRWEFQPVLDDGLTSGQPQD